MLLLDQHGLEEGHESNNNFRSLESSRGRLSNQKSTKSHIIETKFARYKIVESKSIEENLKLTDDLTSLNMKPFKSSQVFLLNMICWYTR